MIEFIKNLFHKSVKNKNINFNINDLFDDYNNLILNKYDSLKYTDDEELLNKSKKLKALGFDTALDSDIETKYDEFLKVKNKIELLNHYKNLGIW